METVAAVAARNDAAFLAILPFLVFMAGFMGTQRVWYLRAFESRPFPAAEIWDRSWRYAPRFILLAVISSLPSLPLLAFGLVSEWAEWAAFVVAWILVDVWITFASPALVYTTRRVGLAFDIGWWFLRRRWASIGWHAVAPPLVVILGARTLPSLDKVGWPVAVVSVAGWMLNLLCKGAQALAYLEHRDDLPHAAR